MRRYNKKYIIGGIILLVVGVIGVALPFVPFWFSADLSYLDQIAAASTPASSNPVSGFSGNSTVTPKPFDPNLPKVANRLLIPQAGISMPIFASTKSSVLSKGGWIFPNTSTPDLGGNTVIFGHRFQYLPPISNTFFHLDKVKTGDEFSVIWKGTVYRYKVSNINIIEPTDLSVLASGDKPIITLITCAPLFSTKQRLVVTADLISTSQN